MSTGQYEQRINIWQFIVSGLFWVILLGLRKWNTCTYTQYQPLYINKYHPPLSPRFVGWWLTKQSETMIGQQEVIRLSACLFVTVEC